MKHELVERLTVPIGKRDHILGPENASASLLEYGDYECPFCGAAHTLVKAILESVGDRICFAFRHFPLSNAHPHAERAAEAAEAAGAQGAFWEMHDVLFENQDALDYDDLAEYAA
ncbi:DsbA family protein, partial [Luteolibacter soli]